MLNFQLVSFSQLYFKAMKPIVLFFLLFTSLVYSQPRSGEVIYKIEKIELEVDKPSDYMTSLINHAKEQKFKLQFTENGSKFTREDHLSANDDTPGEIKFTASIAFTTDFTYYKNKKSNQEFRSRGGSVIENEIVPLDWEITTESKLIGGHLCYKASVPVKYMARNGKEVTKVIVAWFAPSLPFPYGPKEFDGLPGLILELTEKTTTYLATSIKLDTDSAREIDYPKGKTMTEEQYLEKVMSNSRF